MHSAFVLLDKPIHANLLDKVTNRLETSNLWSIFWQVMWILCGLYPLSIYIPRCGFTGASALTFEPNVPIQCSSWATWNRPFMTFRYADWFIEILEMAYCNPNTTELHNPQHTVNNQGFMGFGHCSCWTTNYIMRLPCHMSVGGWHENSAMIPSTWGVNMVNYSMGPWKSNHDFGAVYYTSWTWMIRSFWEGFP